MSRRSRRRLPTLRRRIDDVLAPAARARTATWRRDDRRSPRPSARPSRPSRRDYFRELARGAKGNVSEMARQSGMERHHVRAYLGSTGCRAKQKGSHRDWAGPFEPLRRPPADLLKKGPSVEEPSSRSRRPQR